VSANCGNRLSTVTLATVITELLLPLLNVRITDNSEFEHTEVTPQDPWDEQQALSGHNVPDGEALAPHVSAALLDIPRTEKIKKTTTGRKVINPSNIALCREPSGLQ
jgi:hypothetical protein